MTQHVIIDTNAQLLALQNLPGLSKVIKLVTLGDLASAPNMYQHLHSLLRARLWTCKKLTVLEGFSWLALAVQHLRDDLEGLRPAMNPHAALQGPNSVLHTFARIKYQVGQLKRAKTEIRFRAGELATQVGNLGRHLKDQSDQVLLGSMTIAEFQARIPEYLVQIDNLLRAGMQF
ncbi:hypothetical protein ACQJBY_013683 [Aegilops geniculata]